MPEEETTYKAAGVDIDAADFFVRMIKERVAEAWPEAAREIGGFAGGGSIPVGAKAVRGSTDGTGTKAILAALAEDFSGIGQDAVAMSAVDMYVSGYNPTYLLDSLDVASLKPELHIKIIDSIITACRLADCRLIGGETAELPDMFKHPWMFNLNTMAIGFPHSDLNFVPVKPDQFVYGWFSYGPASNGFSLIRKVFGLKERPSKVRKKLERRWLELGGKTLAQALLKPTPIYIRQIEEQRERGVKFAGHAHITGGGLVENIPRILPQDCKVVIYRSSWSRPSIFPLIQKLGNVPAEDMDRTFNQGIMVVSIVDPSKGEFLTDSQVHVIGQVREREDDEPQVQFEGEYNDGS